MADATTIQVFRPRSFEAYVASEQARRGESADEMWFLLNCIDYRYPRRIVDVMHRLGPGIPYDQFILAGASLGACIPEWQKVFINHVKAAICLGHKIEKILILDHRDCAAFQNPCKIGVPSDVLASGIPEDILPSEETKCHEQVLAKLVPILAKEFPTLKIDAWLLTRDEDDPLSC